MSETIITVEGASDHRHPAERGTVRFSAGFEGGDRPSVMERTTRLHAELAEEAQRLHRPGDGPITWWSADRLRVWSERPWSNDGAQLPLVHHAVIGMDTTFSDIAALGDWAERLAGLDGVTVHGIDWALAEATLSRLTEESRHRAVLDATAKATAYARSLGLSTVRVTALAEPGLLGDESPPVALGEAVTMSRAAKTAPDAGGLDLRPEDVTVSARVHARFAAS
jgi:hypothetical protein